MADTRGVLILGEGAVLKGQVTNGRRVEVWGYVEGGVTAAELVVQEGGKVFGNVRTDTAEVRGTLQGDVRVQQLFSLKSTGTAAGKIKYGRITMEEGAELSAHVRNIPPAIAGDLDLCVDKGRSVRITLADLNAVDPDDRPEDLTFSVSNAHGGFVFLAQAPDAAAATFSQADLAGGQVYFSHDGSDASKAQFDIAVTDAAGASSGPAKTVNVAVRAA
jgi:cytoskeletal protein CcmA (bactofilin family)